MSAAVIYKVKRTSIQGAGTAALELDVTVSESPTLDADVTEHPVEEGFNIADGIRNKPIVLSLEGIISNTPIVGEREATSAGGYLKGNPGRADEAFALLEQLREAQDVVTIATRMKTYKSMAITSIKPTRDAKTGDALSFTIAAKQVRIVSSRFISYPKEPRGAKKDTGGDKGKTELPPKQSKSVLASLVDRLTVGK